MTTRGLDASLTSFTIVELGSRVSVGACGSLLAQLGAKVVFVEMKRRPDRPDTKWAQRAMWAAGKQSLTIDPDNTEDRVLLADIVARSQVILASSDVDSVDSNDSSVWLDVPETVIQCDLTAFGENTERTSPPLFESALQALSGLIHTTGAATREPVLTQLPIIEMSSGVCAAAAVVAALRVCSEPEAAQRVDVSLFECAVTMLATFLPQHFVGGAPERIGNRHPSISPWNCYRTADGWVQLCTGTEDQWLRLKKILVDDGLIVDPILNSRSERLAHLDQLDTLLGGWLEGLHLSDVLGRLEAAGIPCGAVHTISELMADANLLHRGMIQKARDPLTGRRLFIPGNVFTRSRLSTTEIPACDAARDDLQKWRIAPRTRWSSVSADGGFERSSPGNKAPLDGVKILEIGQWTTAPLAARLLAALGADVVKIESLDGDPARGSPPLAHGSSYLFNLNNSEKRCVTIDMRSPNGKADFTRLVERCDVVIENLKPGSLDRLGFSFAALRKLNPKIIYCAISGFGADSIHQGRAAMDTVLQAMCAVMDLTRQEDTPYKVGVSISDLLGGYFGFLGTLAALNRRRYDREAQFIDLSMQDLTAWLTQLSWNNPSAEFEKESVLPCADGFVLVPASFQDREAIAERSRQDAVTFLSVRSVRAIPIMSVAEVAIDSRTKESGIITCSSERNGRRWPLLATPFHLEKTPAQVRNAPVDVGSVEDILKS